MLGVEESVIYTLIPAMPYQLFADTYFFLLLEYCSVSLGWLYRGRSFLADSLSSAAWLSSALRLHRGHEIQSHISYRSYNFILIVRSNFTTLFLLRCNAVLSVCIVPVLAVDHLREALVGRALLRAGVGAGLVGSILELVLHKQSSHYIMLWPRNGRYTAKMYTGN